MTRKIILVTGASDGIGKQTALELARDGAHVLLHGRDEARIDSAKQEILSAAAHASLTTCLADFSSLADVSRLANQVQKDHDRLDVLVNNAGTFSKERCLSADGYELTLAVNHLAPFLLTLLLLERIKSAVPSRIVNVSSGSHRNVSAVDFDNLQGEKSYNGYDAYSLSKLGNVLFSSALARRLAGSGVDVNSLHPGVIDTKLLRMSYDIAGYGLEEGARTSVFLAIAPQAQGISGRYISRMEEKPTSELAQNEDLQEKFWRVSMDMVANFLPDHLKNF